MPPTTGNGKICYLEIPTTDIPRSVRFYQAVFGWSVRKRGDGASAFDDGVGEVSGAWVLGRPVSREPGLLLYVMVDSVAATAATVTAHGGRIVQEIGVDAPEVTARFADLDGNVLGLYQEPNSAPRVDNRELAKRWMQEIWNDRREEVIDELMSPGAVGRLEGGDVQGPAGFKAARAALLQAVPNLKIHVEDTVADGDAVVLRWRITGTHTGEGLGIPASGREVAARGMSWFHFSNGQIREGWDSWNLGGLLEQLRQ